MDQLTSLFLRADIALDAWVISHRVPALDGVMWTLSAIGRGGAVFLAIGLGLFAAKRIGGRDLLRLDLAILLATATAGYVIKPIVGRERPFERQPAIHVIGGRPDDPSFPSGHAANAFAGALALSNGVGLWVLAAAIAFSRVYLGVHYPTDVLGGAAVGIACAAIAARLAPGLTRFRTSARSC